jgi:hypothetical protein
MSHCVRLRADHFPAFSDKGRTGVSTVFANHMMLFVLAAFLLAVAANVDTQSGQFFEARRVKGSKSDDSRAHGKHGGHGLHAILQGGIARTHKFGAVIDAYLPTIHARQGGINQILIFCWGVCGMTLVTSVGGVICVLSVGPIAGGQDSASEPGA